MSNREDIRVLAIDDEKICIEELRESVNWEKLGILPEHVYKAGTVRQAQRVLSAGNLDIIICDIEMPGENGLDFIEWMTEWSRFESRVECIMLTCHPEFEYIRRALRLGCLDYLLKPLDAQEMERVLEKAINRIKKRREKDEKDLKDTGFETQVTIRPTESMSDGSERHNSIVFDQIIPYIDAHVTESISVDSIAEHVSMNPQYMMRLFKKETGRTILVYVTDKRVKLAKEYLTKTDMSIEEITEKVGYYSAAHFNSVFKRVTGMSPGQYRKNRSDY